ncbi:hypothetical protein AK812_SmicGene48869, partial [Symbiodinium microadriaticum]
WISTYRWRGRRFSAPGETSKKPSASLRMS